MWRTVENILLFSENSVKFNHTFSRSINPHVFKKLLVSLSWLEFWELSNLSNKTVKLVSEQYTIKERLLMDVFGF
jgi:hypothetical protein